MLTIEQMALSEKEVTDGPNYHFMARHELYSDSVRKAVHYIKKVKEEQFDSPADSYWYRK